MINNDHDGIIIDPKAIDVYSFAFFLYKMFSFEDPQFDRYKDILPMHFLFRISKNKRPNRAPLIPSHYWELIEKCWSQNPIERPSFDEIIEILKDDKFAIEEFDMKTDLDELHEYQNRIEKETTSLKKIVESLEEEEEVDDEDDDDDEYLDLSIYSKIDKIGESPIGEIFKVRSNENGEFYSAIVSDMSMTKEEFKKSRIYKEDQIISKLNHPCISKFIGFSPTDFEGNDHPSILIEFSSNGTLKQLFDIERKIAPIREWDDTKKFINIYALASCMSYLNSRDIVYKDLNPENVVLDDYLFPKFMNFTFSDDPQNSTEKVVSKDEMFHMAPKYCAPEQFNNNNEITQSSLIYSFSLIMYEIISGNKIFNGQTVFQIMNNVSEGQRPELDESFSNVYQELIIFIIIIFK